jgi:hypothetical protein
VNTQANTRAAARRLYYRARFNHLVGRPSQAAELCRRALAHCDYIRAYRLLARMQLPGADYFSVLEQAHRHLKPATYVEVGVGGGRSLRLARPTTLALGIDPQPRLKQALAPNQKLFTETSDEFFARHDLIAELGGRRVEMAFIDGMHHFDFALRDLTNLEPLCAPNAVIFVHDCYPVDERSATREQRTAFWSGDVWRLIVLLKRHRPDLSVHTIGTPPTGLGLITRLDPSSRVLRDNLDALVAEGLTLELGQIASHKAQALNLFPNDWRRLRALLDAR